jgi:PilZ domain
MSESNRRQYYRIEYDSADCPRFQMGGSTYAVFNLSEGGLMLRSLLQTELKTGMKVKGTLLMPDGARIPISASITRVTPVRVAMSFREHLPLALIMKEQRRIIQATRKD